MPGLVDPARLLVCELVDGAFERVSAKTSSWDLSRGSTSQRVLLPA
jgi:hypothetical protein